MNAPAIEALKAHRAIMLKEGLAGNPLVFPSRRGTVLLKHSLLAAY